MRMIDILSKKRHGEALSKDEIQFFVEGFVKGDIPDYQASALAMAICLQGMTEQETTDLTLAMAASGDQVDLSSISGIKVDKHSTGGVGDTTTLIVAPLVASCGVPVAKMSGRGLGHTGGTIDKLESLPGIDTERSVSELIDIVKRIGLAVVGQSGNLVPADKKLYALRDVTATVDSIPLIASSVMSKKIAAGSDAIVLDVKTGKGAFMQTPEEAFELARQMVAIGALAKRNTVALVTDMNQPLGRAIGNALEVKEAIEVLNGTIPQDDPLVKVSLLLGRYMLLLGDAASTEEDADKMILQALLSGAGLEKLRALFKALGNDGACIDDPSMLGKTAIIMPVYARQSGYVSSIDALELGLCAQILGAGRTTKDDVIDHEVGIVMNVRCSDKIKAGDPLCHVYANDMGQFRSVETRILQAISIQDHRMNGSPMVYGVVSEGGIDKAYEGQG